MRHEDTDAAWVSLRQVWAKRGPSCSRRHRIYAFHREPLYCARGSSAQSEAPIVEQSRKSFVPGLAAQYGDAIAGFLAYKIWESRS